MFHSNGPTFFELARQALSSTRVGYDLLAEKFDHTPFRTPASILAGFDDYLKHGPPVKSALDICCGTGAAMEILLRAGIGRVVGIDFSEPMLAVARSNLSGCANFAAAEFVHRDVMAMDFESEFDLAVCFGALGHIRHSEEDEFVARIARALRPGGRFVFFSHEMPTVINPLYWLAVGFNVAMFARNLLIRPPFVMYYLTFLWPDVKPLLRRHGLIPQVHSPFRGRMKAVRLVVGERPRA